MTLPELHFRETEKLLRAISTDKVAHWLLNEGYYPEQYVLPPSFYVDAFELQATPYNPDLKNLARRQLINISYPKTLLTSRVFGIQHPWNYHDIVYYLMQEWALILDHLFHEDLKFFSYSFPIPVNARNVGELSPLRSGRMIYEWILMAEKDLVAEAHNYSCIIRTDISNFYNSVYTHSIGWALHSRETAFADKDYDLIGNKIDRLIQYANDGRTNGIPVGPALSDLIAEIILSNIDKEVSQKLNKLKFVATRFKDDYRILCNSEEDAKAILNVLSDELEKYNLLINENKTKIHELPEGLYRQHDREYLSHSLKEADHISFKKFEHTLLIALNIHRSYPGTSIIEKFLSELFDTEHELKIVFSVHTKTRAKQLLKTVSLLFLLQRESEKVLCYVLSVIEAIYIKYGREHNLRKHLKGVFEREINMASEKESVFELIWLVFFSRYIKLGITDFSSLIKSETCKNNLFLKSILSSQQKIFNDSHITLFRKPRNSTEISLAKQLAVFARDNK